MAANIAIIGAGKWGQGLHFALSQRQPCVITSPHTKQISDFVSIEEALKCEYLVFALSAQGINAWLNQHFEQRNSGENSGKFGENLSNLAQNENSKREFNKNLSNSAQNDNSKSEFSKNLSNSAKNENLKSEISSKNENFVGKNSQKSPNFADEFSLKDEKFMSEKSPNFADENLTKNKNFADKNSVKNKNLTDENFAEKTHEFYQKSENLIKKIPQNELKNKKILLASKGIDTRLGLFLDEIFLRFVKRENFCVLSGPSFASEVMQKLPCALCVSGVNIGVCEEFAAFFPDFIKLYTNTDVRGAEICGAYKNVLAIASGICEGLGLGNNARASLIARGLIEMQRFGSFFGTKSETFLGLSGAGDLFLTASSTLSRNFRAGILLARGRKKDEVLSELKEVVEGIDTAFAIQSLAKKHEIYTPIVNEVVAILLGKDVCKSLKDLLSH